MPYHTIYIFWEKIQKKKKIKFPKRLKTDCSSNGISDYNCQCYVPKIKML